MNILTRDQFVDGLFSVLALCGRKEIIFEGTKLDKTFELAFQELLTFDDDLGIRADFTFHVEPNHGDSVTLRETLLYARDRNVIDLWMGSFGWIIIRMGDNECERRLATIPIPRSFFETLVRKYFNTIAYEEWYAQAKELGLIHTFDHIIVCEDENDVCVGEWFTTTNSGWINHDTV